MGHPVLLGVSLVMVAGLMCGCFMLPLKFVRSWRWENVWLVFSILSFAVIPWLLALAFVGRLFDTYRVLSAHQLAVPMLLGAGWGIAQLLFGVSVKRLGLGIAYGIGVGLAAVFGTVVHLFVQQRGFAKEHALELIVCGVLIMAIVLVLTSWGGQIKERATARVQNPAHLSYPIAIFIVVLSGLIAPMLNYSFAFGQDIAKAAVAFGNQPVRASHACWPIGVAAALI